MEIILPIPVKFILNRLKECGYEGYIVGGCVRDYIMGVFPHDWDICTDALPEQIIEVFKDKKVLPTGMQHGTVSVVFDDVPKPFNIYEITTYRIDGEYKDNRHPENVEFVSQLELDLARRDFTINAMAYNEEKGLVDIYGGLKDIENRTIRCVGNPDERFSEDALRIMRAIPFALRFNYVIEPETFYSMNNHKELLKSISVERTCSELSTICSTNYFRNRSDKEEYIQQYNNTSRYISSILDYIEVILPKDIYKRPLSRSVFKKFWYAESEQLEVNLAILFNSPNIVDILKFLRFSNQIIDSVYDIYVYGHQIAKDYPTWITPNEDKTFERIDKYYARKMLHNIKNCKTFFVTDFAKSLCIDYFPFGQDGEKYSFAVFLLDIVMLKCRETDVYELKKLAIDGNVLKELGYQGREIGKILNGLLDLVMRDKVKNNHDDLIIAIPQVMTNE